MLLYFEWISLSRMIWSWNAVLSGWMSVLSWSTRSYICLAECKIYDQPEITYVWLNVKFIMINNLRLLWLYVTLIKLECSYLYRAECRVVIISKRLILSWQCQVLKSVWSYIYVDYKQCLSWTWNSCCCQNIYPLWYISFYFNFVLKVSDLIFHTNTIPTVGRSV